MKLLMTTLFLMPVISSAIEFREIPREISENTEAIFYEVEGIKNKGSKFPSDHVRAYDPINKTRYEKAIVGKVYRNSDWFSDYDYWRYVTVYDVNEVSERIAYLPYFEEDCHDASMFMAQWGERRTFDVSFTSSLGAEALGLNASVSMTISQGVSFETTRRVMATQGLVARHYPHMIYEEWSGVTYIQIYNSKTKELGFLAPSLMQEWSKSYPSEFFLDKQNMGFKVKREIIRKCSNYDPNADETGKLEVYNHL